MIAAARAKNAVMLGASLALIVFSLAHGLDWLVLHGMHDENYDAFIQYIVDSRGRWLAVHLVGLVLFPLPGVAVWLMLPPGGVASRISRVGLAVYIVLYPASMRSPGSAEPSWRAIVRRCLAPLAVGGATFAQSHFPPFGAIAGVCLAIAAWQFVAPSSTPAAVTVDSEGVA